MFIGLCVPTTSSSGGSLDLLQAGRLRKSSQVLALIMKNSDYLAGSGIAQPNHVLTETFDWPVLATVGRVITVRWGNVWAPPVSIVGEERKKPSSPSTLRPRVCSPSAKSCLPAPIFSQSSTSRRAQSASMALEKISPHRRAYLECHTPCTVVTPNLRYFEQGLEKFKRVAIQLSFRIRVQRNSISLGLRSANM
ncbi:hypothetical protein AEP_01709 [Curvibacter sp. AEP1-3]|nr:hypothetical protein AEP_01709 [Curvibacter sp. AEP1-3]